MVCIEIEDYDGNTIGAILLDKDIEIINSCGFDIADREDYENFFGTTDSKIRIQMNRRFEE